MYACGVVACKETECWARIWAGDLWDTETLSVFLSVWRWLIKSKLKRSTETQWSQCMTKIDWIDWLHAFLPGSPFPFFFFLFSFFIFVGFSSFPRGKKKRAMKGRKLWWSFDDRQEVVGWWWWRHLMLVVKGVSCGRRRKRKTSRSRRRRRRKKKKKEKQGIDR